MNGVAGVLPVLGNVGPSALLAVVVLMVLTGRLVTRRQLEDVRADRDHWRTAADEWQKVTSKLGIQVEKLLVQSEATAHVMQQIQQAHAQALEREGPHP